MNALISPTSALSAQQLALVRSTICKDATNQEFELFIEVCKSTRLNPFRKQIFLNIYSKDDPAKRSMVIIVGIDGLRAIANDQGNYRPDDEEPEYEIDVALKSDTNPAGLVKAKVKVWKQDRLGTWYPIAGSAQWSEFAPVSNALPEDGFDWIDTGETWPDSGKPKKKKVAKKGIERIAKLEGKWAEMPRHMLAKVAESIALRKGWPAQLAALYSEEETERSRVIDLTATEIVAEHQAETRLKQINAANTITFAWMPGLPLEQIPLGQIADRSLEFFAAARNAKQITEWAERNRVALREFWARASGDALAVKQKMEERIASLSDEQTIMSAG